MHQDVYNGDYELQTWGDSEIVAMGGTLTLQSLAADVAGEAEEEEKPFIGAVLVSGESLTNICSGEAAITLLNDEVEKGIVQIQAGAAGQVALGVGEPEIGPMIKLEGPEQIKISVGPEVGGASITMTPESIKFQVAETMVEITPEGITEMLAEVSRELSPEGHNLTAAETEVNVGVEGVVIEAPVQDITIEGAAETSMALHNVTVEGVQEEEITLLMTE